MSRKSLKVVIQSWNEAKGFGFITPAAGGKRVFIHISDVKGNKHVPDVGEKLTYQLGKDSQNRSCAKNVYFENDLKPSSKNKLKIILALLSLLFLCLLTASTLLKLLPVYVLYIYLILSSITFLVYWRDKSAAQKNKWRTKENTLHLLALVGGWPGAVLGQQLIRHKSKKISFQVMFWLAVILNLIFLFWVYTDDGRSFLDSAMNHFKIIFSV